MIRNYIKIALRNLLKNRTSSLINLIGLSIGIACCMLIMVFVTHELSYDRWNPNANRIVRPINETLFGGNHFKLAVVGSPIGPDAATELPEIQAWCRFRRDGNYLVRRDGDGQTSFKEEKVFKVDSSFFEIFPVPVIQGEARTCLTRPNTLAISSLMASKYFGTPQMAIGQTLILENRERWQVTAVFEDIPVNTHFEADMLLAMNGNVELANDSPMWAVSNNFNTYFLLRPGTEPAAFREKFMALSREKISYTAQQAFGISLQDFEKTGQFVRFDLQPLTDIHLKSDLIAELGTNGSIQYVWIFSAIAVFILFIACVNFMNLSTARSIGRAKEIGLRKTLGSQRAGLVRQFLTESVGIAFFATFFAFLLAVVAMPWYNQLTGKPLYLPISNPLFWLGIIGIILIVGLAAGSYPALFLSRFDAIKSLKGQTVTPGKKDWLRSSLVVFQFITSTALIVATLVVFRQLNYIQNKKLGFSKEQVIILNDAYALGDKVKAFKEKMLEHPSVMNASVSSYLPVPSSRSDEVFMKIRSLSETEGVSMQNWRVDPDYIATLVLPELSNGIIKCGYFVAIQGARRDNSGTM